jgi:hypothetical protein
MRQSRQQWQRRRRRQGTGSGGGGGGGGRGRALEEKEKARDGRRPRYGRAKAVEEVGPGARWWRRQGQARRRRKGGRGADEVGAAVLETREGDKVGGGLLSCSDGLIF